MSKLTTLQGCLGAQEREILHASVLADKDSAAYRVADAQLLKAEEIEASFCKSRQDVKVHANLTYAERESLQEMYPEFNVTFLSDVNQPHAMAAASRKLEKLLLLKRLRAKKTTKVCDFGGNWYNDLAAGRINIHSCCPILDWRDSGRETERYLHAKMLVEEKSEGLKKSLYEYMTASKLTGIPANEKNMGPTLEKFLFHSKQFKCHNRAEDCDHQASLAIGVHSLYDMTVETLIKAMYRHGVTEYLGTIMFSDKIFVKDSGIVAPLNYEYEIDRKADLIKFSFVDDMSNGYCHKFSEYLRFFTTFTQTYKGVTFTFERMENRGGIQIIKVLRCGSPAMFPKTTFSFSNVWLSGNKKKLAVKVFDYNYGANKILGSDLVESFVLIEKDLYEATTKYAKGLKDTQLTKDIIFNHLKTYDSRIIVNGTDVTSKEPHDVDDLDRLAQVIYLKVCFDRYAGNQVMDRLVRIEDSRKKLMRGSLLGVFGVWINRTLTNFGNISTFESLKQRLMDDMDFSKFALEFNQAPLSIELSEFAWSFFTSGERKAEQDLIDAAVDYQKSLELADFIPDNTWSEKQKQQFVSAMPEHMPGFDFDSETSSVIHSDDTTEPSNEDSPSTSSNDTDNHSNDSESSSSGSRNDHSSHSSDSDDTSSSDNDDEDLITATKRVLFPGTGEMTEYSSEYPEEIASQSYSDDNNIFSVFGEEEETKTAQPGLRHSADKSSSKRTKTRLASKKRTSEDSELSAVSKIDLVRRENYFAYLKAENENCKATLKEDHENIFGRKFLNTKEMEIAHKARETNVLKRQRDGFYEPLMKRDLAGEFSHGFDGKKFVEIRSSLVLDFWRYEINSEELYVVVNKNTRLLQSGKKLEVLAEKPKVNTIGRVTLIEGVPGCGKTTDVMKRAGNKDVILTVGRETAQDIREKLKEQGKKTKVYTVDSYILNCRRQFLNVYLDEGMMIHPGEIDIIKDLTQCNEMFVYGDRQQIPFICRVPDFDVTEEFYSGFANIETQNISYRCPHDVAAVLSRFYEKGFRSGSKVERSINLKPIRNVSDVPKGSYQYLTWTQEDKKEMRRRGYNNCITVHEAQGKTWNKVIMVRLNTFKLDLFESQPHALVALSRHREEFFYCTKANLVNDALAKLSDKDAVRNALIAAQDGFQGPKERSFTDVAEAQDFRIDLPKIPPADCPDAVEVLQNYYDMIFPEAASEYYDLDAYQIEHQDLTINLEDCRLEMSKIATNVDHTALEQYDYVSKLRTGQPHTRPRTMRQALLTLEKRNLNRPDNSKPCSIEVLKKLALEKFLKTYCHPKARDMLKEYSKTPVGPDSTDLGNWLADYKDKKLKMIEDPDFFPKDYEFKDYEMMLKTEPKNKLERNGCFEYPILQNLLVHKKKVNALFSPIFRVLFERFSSLLKPSVYCHLRKNQEHLNEHLNQHLDIKGIYKLLEIDQEKFDKSQTEQCFEIEMFFLSLLGLDATLLQIWSECHKSSSGINFTNGIKAHLIYQRKTGDAMTCFGNTMISMIALGTVFDLTHAVAMYFVGDDSFVFGLKDFEAEKGSRNLSYYFNLKGKVINSDHGFFCSYFFANNGLQWRAIVDPLKRTERLGKHIKLNEEFATLHERFVSFADLASCYDDASYFDSVSQMVANRYKINVNSNRAMEALFALSKDFSLFSSLYEEQKGHY